MIKRDLTGLKFGKLTVVSPTNKRSSGCVVWRCICDCGNTRLIPSQSLTTGNTKSCGCLYSTNLVGKRFGKLLVLELVPSKGRRFYRCLCDCGKQSTVRAAHLKGSKISSCGCMQGNKGLEYGDASFNSLYSTYIRGAKIRGLSFELSKEIFKILTQSDCYYCGVKPYLVVKRSRNNGNYTYMGVDRVDNSSGYIDGNVVPCCIKCQRAKNSVSIDIMSKALRFLGYTIVVPEVSL